MKFFAVVLLFAACAFATDEEEFIPILRSDIKHHEDGEYSVAVETGNGIALSSKGHLRDGEEGKVVVVEGTYSYVGDDGRTYTVSYIADEYGYRAAGDHFPVAPKDPHHH